MVLITFITTPTQAYEAYNNIASLLILEEGDKETKSIITSTELIAPKEEVSTPSQEISTPETYDLCQIAITEVEQTNSIKPNLLTTIASVESGRYISSIGKRKSWPWTIHAQGKGYYLPTKQEAIAKVKALQSQGITNIDVGCMQINLKYHGNAFNNLDEAFDPKKNVSYSANFLQKLHQKNNNNWQKTAMQYHSKNFERGLSYKNRLETHYAKFIQTDTTSLF